MKNKIHGLIGLLIAAGLIAIFIVLLAKPSATTVINPSGAVQRDTISVSGRAEMEVMPDLAILYVRIETLAPTAKESQEQNADITDDVKKALSSADMIETQQYNIWEQFDYYQGKRTSKGFATTHVLKVTADVDDAGKLLDSAVDAGANRIDRISFELSDDLQADIREQVLEKSAENAKDKADILADATDSSVGKVISISESNYFFQPYDYYPRAEMLGIAEDKAETEISPSEVTTSATVNVVYELE